MKTIQVADATHHALMQRKLDTGAASMDAVIAACMGLGDRRGRFESRRAIIDAICRRHLVRRLRMFGSARHHTDGPDSDIDLIVDFEPDARPGLFGLAQLQDALAEALGARVDITTPAGLHPKLRPHIIEDAIEVWHA